jgi:hypothetical protein
MLRGIFCLCLTGSGEGVLLGEISDWHELQQVRHQDEDVRALPDVVDVDAWQQQVQQVDGTLGVGPHQGPGRRRQGLRKITLEHKRCCYIKVDPAMHAP